MNHPEGNATWSFSPRSTCCWTFFFFCQYHYFSTEKIHWNLSDLKIKWNKKCQCECGRGRRLPRASAGCNWLVVMMCCSIWRSRERPSSSWESLLSPGHGVRIHDACTLVTAPALDVVRFDLELHWLLRVTHLQDLQPCGLHLRGQYGDHADGGVGHSGQQQHRRNRWASERACVRASCVCVL